MKILNQQRNQKTIQTEQKTTENSGSSELTGRGPKCHLRGWDAIRQQIGFAKVLSRISLDH
jgi:hypothetical protein